MEQQIDEVLQIELLGGFRALQGGKLVAELDSAKLQALLAYVVLHAGTPQPRRHVAFTFWPNSTEKQSLTNLRKLLHLLRKALKTPDRFIHVDAKNITWRDDARFTVDVHDFERALARADEARQGANEESTQAALAKAADRYRGKLLPALYDDWVLAERERLHQRAMRALEELARLLEGHRKYADAIRYAGRLVQLDPLREPSYRLLMRLHSLSGDRAGALRTYRSAADTLKQELGAEPEPATRALYDQLSSGEVERDSTPVPHAVTEIPLVGRQAEWKRLRAAWSKASEGAAHMATITGEAGIGKTRVAEELLQWAARQGFATAQSRSYAAEGRMAFAPIVDWLRSESVRGDLRRLDAVWLSEVARLLPELRREHPDLPTPSETLQSWERPHLLEALARGLLASGQPLLLLLDDVQWCDSDTLEWLRFLLRFAPGAKLLVVGTVRMEEVDPAHAFQSMVLDLGRTQQVTEIALEALAEADTTRLGEHVAQRKLESDQAAKLFEETEGNPLFVVESVRAGLTFAPTNVPGEAPPADAPLSKLAAVPPSVQAVLKKRLKQLSPRARTLSELAAVIGRTFTFELVEVASGHQEAHLAEALDELWRRRIIREQETGVYDFSHEKLREAAYSEIAPAERRLLHRRVAGALEAIHAHDQDAVSAQVAFHCERGGLIDQAIASYQRAARVAQQLYANDEVVRVLTRALALLAAQPKCERRDERELAARTALGPSLIALYGYSSTEATEHYERARELCSQLGRPIQPAILRAIASAYVIGGELTRGHQAAEELLQQGRQRADSLMIVEAHYVLGIASFWRGRFTASREHLEEALASFDSDHRKTHLALYGQDPQVICLSRLAWTLWYLGYPKQAVRECEECLALAGTLEHPFSQAYALYFTAHLAIDQRNEPAADRRVQALLRLCREQGFPLFELLGRILQAWLRIARGHVETGFLELREGLEAMPKAKVHLLRSYSLALLAHGYLKAGRAVEGLRAVSQAFEFIERYEERFFEAELHRIRGLLQLMQGKDEAGAEAQFHQAIAVARRQQAKSLELRVQLDLSRLWHRQGKTAAAKQSLQLLYTWFGEREDTPDLAETRALLVCWS